MDFINSILKVIIDRISQTAFPFIYPIYFFFKFISFIIRSISAEDVAGKVVLITGASSGIGEHLAYEYAKRGAYLALVARRDHRLRDVADVAEILGSPYALVIHADVSNLDDCQRCVDTTVGHFGQLDHLVNNAGITSINLFEEYVDPRNIASVMDTDFWGTVYCTYYAIPYLKQTRGKIIGIASSAAWLPTPRLSFYSASKAAVISFYETLRVEIGSEIGITVVTPGLIESEMTKGKFMFEDGKMYIDQELRDAVMSVMPIEPVGGAVEAMLRAGCRGDEYVTEPPWLRMSFYWKMFLPEVVEWLNYLFIMTGSSPTDTFGKWLLELTGLKPLIYPPSVRSPELGIQIGVYPNI
ncbi:11-beta-hydroxysteroid dehydrogenase 1B-like [Cucurbita pepo subsp. pepo]|uniref:11-beta-hydroxysteroid dehydrogenase 1B-like n=1 Tax=Cucurbita pepo subsp. pepo TaxID=3664 RepID=UPI000C9D4E24|nr:11-beta-hydroxysteroid dehydrogenase 1B-like [Cucurbita pepo subsp. pepo]